MAKKKEFQAAEHEFLQKERQLREKDTTIQQTLIKFASYLDGNRKKLDRYKASIEELNAINKIKDAEIQRKDKQLEILKEKA